MRTCGGIFGYQGIFGCFQRFWSWSYIFSYLPESSILLELIDGQELHRTEANRAQVLLTLTGQVTVVPAVHLNNHYTSCQLGLSTELREISQCTDSLLLVENAFSGSFAKSR